MVSRSIIRSQFRLQCCSMIGKLFYFLSPIPTLITPYRFSYFPSHFKPCVGRGMVTTCISDVIYVLYYCSYMNISAPVMVHKREGRAVKWESSEHRELNTLCYTLKRHITPLPMMSLVRCKRLVGGPLLRYWDAHFATRGLDRGVSNVRPQPWYGTTDHY